MYLESVYEDLDIPKGNRTTEAAGEEVVGKGGVEGENPCGAGGVQVSSEGVKDVEVGLCLENDYLVSLVTTGHELAAQVATQTNRIQRERGGEGGKGERERLQYSTSSPITREGKGERGLLVLQHRATGPLQTNCEKICK